MSKQIIYLISFVFVLGVALTSTVNAQDPNLVGWWKLDDEGTGTVLDYSGNGRDGTLIGSPQFVPGVYGQAMEFHGDPDYVNIDGYKGLLGGHAFSITAWIKTDGNGEIVGWGNNTGTERIEFRINDYRLRTEHGSGSRQGDTFVSDNEWHHVALTVEENATISYPEVILYLDGEDDTRSGTDSDAFNIVENFDVKIALRYNGSDRWFIGLIDDVRIYDRVLSADEIKNLAIPPTASKPSPADGVIHPETGVSLSWSPGADTISHDVYFGDNFDDVNAGAEDAFQGNQAETSFTVGFSGFPYPDGLVLGTTYYWRIDEVNDADPNSPWKGDVWSFVIPPNTAYNPVPADGAKFIDPNVELGWTAGLKAMLHTVYFGDNFDDVNNAVVGVPQSATTYTPAGPLELEKTYYWRVDEFDGADTYKGDVWSFKTLPVIPITDPNLVGWWTLNEGMGSTALDWSGHGNHGTLFGSEWAVPGFLGDAALNFSRGGYVAIQNLSYNSTDNTEVTVCAWIRTIGSGTQYIASFDRDNYWRLEINGSGGGPGQVGWDVMTSSGQVDYGSVTRVDDGLWHHVTGVYDNGKLTIYIDARPEASASGGNTFGSGNTRFGFIGANSEATGFNGSRGDGSPISGEIDELRIYHKALTQEEIQLAMRGDPSLAWGPNPSQGSAVYIRDATPLSWSPGDNASQHDVYFVTDRDAIADADASDTTGIYRGRQGITIYTPPEVEWGGGPYYWRVDEYNTDATISKGNVWSFTVADFIGIDDIEDYNDYPPDEIFSTWIDGWENPTNGSQAGYTDPPFAETGNVHGGSQSMPVYYENNFKYSEITMTLVSVRDWTEEGVGVLSLWFYGDVANAAERMYVNLNGIATVYHGNPNAALIDTWTEWAIDLQEFAAQGVNLANVTTISIGFGDKNNLQAGGSGMVLFDDIRLYRPAPEPEPAP